LFIEYRGEKQRNRLFFAIFHHFFHCGFKNAGAAIKLESDEANIVHFQMNKTNIGVPALVFGPEDK